MGSSSVANKTKKLFDLQAGKCFYCRRCIDIKQGNLDHIKPKSDGGSMMLDNLVFCCQPINVFLGRMDVKARIAFLMQISAHYGSAGLPNCSKWSAQDRSFMLKTRAKLASPVAKAKTTKNAPAYNPSHQYELALQAINGSTKRTKIKASGNGKDMITIKFGDIKGQYSSKLDKWMDSERARPFYGLNAFLQWARAMDLRRDILPVQQAFSQKEILEKGGLFQSFAQANGIKIRSVQGAIFDLNIEGYAVQFNCVTQDWNHPLSQRDKRGTHQLLGLQRWLADKGPSSLPVQSFRSVNS